MLRLHWSRTLLVCVLGLVWAAGCSSSALVVPESSGPDGAADASDQDTTDGGEDAGETTSDDGGTSVDAGPTPVGPTICEGATMLDPTALGFRTCELCADAFCVPNSFVPAGQADLLASCEAGGKCVPDVLVRSLGMVQLAACTSINGLEGRCLSTCFPQVRDQAGLLPQDVCREEELCTPCFDPLSGEPTGVCSLGCDPGPSEPPSSLAECCGGLGACVPETLVPEAQRDLLGTDSCTEEGQLCAPTALADSSFRPASCSSVGGLEGRCLPACLPVLGAQADRLPQDSCDEGLLCAPCFDPFTEAPTGACSLNGDQPATPPEGLAECCGGEGSCVPGSLVPAEQQGLLGTDTCEDAEQVCVPNDLTRADYRPPACQSVGGFEGRCLPTCLPDVAAQADRLPADSCMDGQLCVPCFDPLSGEPTGVCSLNGDAPSSSPEDNEFAPCCTVTGGDQVGLCVPESLVPEAVLSLVPRDTCAEGQRCVPEEQLTDPGAPLPSCDVGAGCKNAGVLGAAQYLPGDNTGVCMPECLLQSRNEDGPIPDVAHNGRQTCEQGRVCVACQIRMCLFNECFACQYASLGPCSTGVCGGEANCL